MPPEVREYLAIPPDLPIEGLYLWQWFSELHGQRGSSGFGLNPISWSDLYAWVSLRRAQPTLWELDVLCKLDGAWLSAFHKSKDKK